MKMCKSPVTKIYLQLHKTKFTRIENPNPRLLFDKGSEVKAASSLLVKDAWFQTPFEYTQGYLVEYAREMKLGLFGVFQSV